MSLRLTIAMPAYNEERGIARAVAEALSALDELEDGARGEVLVIDDGSTDRTGEILTELARSDERLRVVRHVENLGIGGFNRSMISEARGEWVFFIGADGEWDPREAIRFLQAAEREGYDGVLGHRVEKRYTMWRKVVSWSFNRSLRVLFGVNLRDVGSIRLLRRRRFSRLKLYSQSAFLNAERLLVGQRLGARLLEVPVLHRRRLSGRGRGARPAAVLAAVRDLLLTRLRWFRFEHFYVAPGAP